VKLTIRCDGESTVVIDEQGVDISRFVHKVEFVHQAKKSPTATVTFLASALDFVGEARVAVEAVIAEEGLGKKS